MTTPTLGRIVNYTTATGNLVTAQVICTEASYSPGRYVNRMSPEGRREALAGDRNHYREDGVNVAALDTDGDEWISSPVPAVKEGRVHLKVTAPNGNQYVEYNVPEDPFEFFHPDTPGEPGHWHFPPTVQHEPVYVDPGEDDEAILDE